jgi:hypothetical protein
MSAHDIFDIDAPVQVLVGLDVFVDEGRSDLGVVVCFREKP